MRIIIVLFCCLLAGLTGGELTAQKDPVVFSLVGKGKYYSAENKKEKLKSGQSMEAGSRLLLKKGAEVGVFYNDSYAFFQGPMELTYEALFESEDFRSSDLTRILGLQLDYGNLDIFIDDGFGFTDGSAGTLPKKKEKSGGGNKDRALSIQEPLTGKLSADVQTFSWILRDPEKSADRYNFVIRDAAKEVRYQQEVKGNSHTVSLKQIGLSYDDTYYWDVTAIGVDDIDSGPLEMALVSEENFNQIKAEMAAEKLYQRSSDATKLTSEAFTMERYGFLEAARTALRQAKTEHRRDPLVNRLYNAFLYRNDIMK